MSVVTLQIGQCGNQVGHELFSCLSKYKPKSFFRWPNNSKKDSLPISRSLLIDMEPKVIHKCLTSPKDFIYSKKNSFYKQSGSANNWSFGYVKQGPSCKMEILNIVRKEIEKCSKFNGFLIMQSLAGGTGSGVGTYISEILREEYKYSYMVNLIVWPYSLGEITLQNYNTILSLSHLYECSDCIWFYLNDFINDVCVNDLKIESPSFYELNRVIGVTSSSVLLPGKNINNGKKKNVLVDLVYQLCGNPSYKFVCSKFYPFLPEKSKVFQQEKWSSVLKQTYQMMLSKDKMINWKINKRNVNKNISSFLTLRGNEIDNLTTPLKPFIYPYKDLFVNWYEKTEKCKIFVDKTPFETEKSACITMNSQIICSHLDSILEKSSLMFHENAYLHHYEKYGIKKDDFVEILKNLENVLYNYKNV